MFDTIITGGDIIDGTGSPRYRADLGLRDGRIATIGDLSAAQAADTVDATGKAVCPGFIDVHTHLDAQVFWDTTLSPSPLHGVTSVIGGNCGFTIAPLSDNPADGEYLMHMLARVEGMPLESLQEGVPWNWRSTAEYFDAFDGTLSINTAFKVGHSALRRVVMGEDCVRREATPEELEEMKSLLRAGLEAGALGFSSSWARTHNDPFGNMVPSRYAGRHELVELARVCSEFEGTSLELIPCVGPFDDDAISLMTDMSVAAQTQLNWNVMTVGAANLDDCYAKLRASDHARAHGGKVVALTVPMAFSVRLSMAGGFVLDALPEWESAMLAPPAEKLALLSDQAERDRLAGLAAQPGPLQGVADWSTKIIFDTFAPENEQYEGRTVGEIAEDEGKTPFDALCDIVVADELRTSFGTAPPVSSPEDWKARMEIWRDGRAVIGASDAGAHLDLFMTANYATTMLGQCMREQGLISTEEAVHLMTDVQARLYGLRERGQLQEGWHGDVVVMDETRVGARPLTTLADLPAGAPRLYGEADGIDHVFCNGAEIVRHGQFTDARPGKHLRSGSDTRQVELA
ncbi:N-acyl-D-amino-acid deacylase family protein [Candidatus Poriferisocius sp.]|uniref:N-acyl-D-amino-acid deacylase family protein n=1 Tax=Candidatus Poriferisocius sp. TaxID=3101276 RepID=UPI003B59CEBA